MMNTNYGHGTIFVFTGTSGSGRKTVAKQIAKELGFVPIVSCTTRTPRPREVEGVDYKFLSRRAFIDADIAGEFFQTVEIDGHFYGIRKEDIDKALATHPNVYVIVNRYAANRFKFEYGDRAVRMFIYASKQTIVERLQSRGMPMDVIDHYMNHYIEEVSYRKQCEHVFENMDLQHTIEGVRKAVLSHMPTTTS